MDCDINDRPDFQRQKHWIFLVMNSEKGRCSNFPSDIFDAARATGCLQLPAARHRFWQSSHGHAASEPHRHRFGPAGSRRPRICPCRSQTAHPRAAEPVCRFPLAQPAVGNPKRTSIFASSRRRCTPVQAAYRHGRKTTHVYWDKHNGTAARAMYP